MEVTWWSKNSSPSSFVVFQEEKSSWMMEWKWASFLLVSWTSWHFGAPIPPDSWWRWSVAGVTCLASESWTPQCFSPRLCWHRAHIPSFPSALGAPTLRPEEDNGGEPEVNLLEHPLSERVRQFYLFTCLLLQNILSVVVFWWTQRDEEHNVTKLLYLYISLLLRLSI